MSKSRTKREKYLIKKRMNDFDKKFFETYGESLRRSSSQTTKLRLQSALLDAMKFAKDYLSGDHFDDRDIQEKFDLYKRAYEETLK